MSAGGWPARRSLPGDSDVVPRLNLLPPASRHSVIHRFIDYRHGNGILGTVAVALEEGPDMQLSPSAHADTFCRDNLPPADQWPDLDFSLAGLSYPERLNAADELLKPTIEAGGANRRCLLSPDQAWSYGDVANRAGQVARVLTDDLGLVPGNRVLLRGPNNPWQAVCWLGVLKAGGVAGRAPRLLAARELGAAGRRAQ